MAPTTTTHTIRTGLLVLLVLLLHAGYATTALLLAQDRPTTTEAAPATRTAEACATVDGVVVRNLHAMGAALDYHGPSGAWTIRTTEDAAPVLLGHSVAEDADGWQACADAATIRVVEAAQP